jgi:O-antigen ligase
LRSATNRRLGQRPDGPLTVAALAAAAGPVFGLMLSKADGALPDVSFVVAGGVAALAVVAMAFATHPAVIALGFVSLGVVLVEPAPSDVLFAACIAVAAATGRLALDRLPVQVTGLLVAFLGLNVLSALAPVDETAAWRFFAVTLYLALFAVWLAGYVNSGERARLVMRGYVFGAAVVGGLASLAPFVSFPGHELLMLPDGSRAKGLFKDPNVFGPFLVPAALLLIEEIVSPRLLAMRRVVKLALLIAVGTGILFSYSRAAWLNASLGIVVMLTVFMLRRHGMRQARALVLLVASLSVALIILITVTGSGDFLAGRAQLQAYDADRFGAQAAAPRLAEDHILGVGPGQFSVVAQQLGAHSLYARTLGEQGFLGLGVILALMIVTLWLAWRNVALGCDTWGIGSSMLLAAWCGLIVNSAVVDTLHWRHLWVVAALIWAGAARRTTPRISSTWNAGQPPRPALE